MRTASPARRAAGFLAVTTIGLSTAVLSVTGVASAALAPFSGTVTATSGAGSDVSITIPDGYCAITWDVRGGQGGADAQTLPVAGDQAGELRLTTEVAPDDVFLLQAGQAGGAAGVATAGGRSGTEISGGAGDATSGSGGGASTVRAGGTTAAAVYLLAHGGDGAGNAGGAGGGEGDNSVFPSFMDREYSDGATAGTGHGSISYTGVPCSAPPAPEVEEGDTEVGENSITVRFFAPTTSYDGEPRRDDAGMPYEEVSGYEVKVDGGEWASTTPVRDPDDAEDEALYATVTGLTNGTTHTVQLRTTSVVGAGGESAVVSATPVHTYPAPTDVTVTTGVRSMTVAWKAPADTAGITGYFVEAYPQFEGDPEGQDLAMGNCEATATDRTCTFPVKAGFAYSVIVSAMADGEYRNTPSVEVLSGQVPGFVAPTSLPTADSGDVSTSSGTALDAGETFTLSGSGYLAGSTVDLVVYSTPIVLGAAVADVNGDFSAEVTLPEELANGTHHLVAAGVDAAGNPRYLVTEITVSGGVATVTSSGLAYTGFSAAPFVGAGALALLAGGGLLVASRRRQA